MTKEEFEKMAKQMFIERMSAWDQQEVREYADGKEASEVIEEAFMDGEKTLDKRYPELSEEAFWKSAASSAAYCMTLLF